MRVLVAAGESAGAQALGLVHERGHEIVAVLTSDGARGTPVAKLATKLGLDLRDSGLVRDPALARQMAEWEVDLMLNVHSLHVAAGEVVAAPRVGAFNLHPGPLPRYAGLDAPSWAIYEGRRSHAVTLHWMEASVDAGDVAYAAGFPIAPEDTGLAVFANCVRHGVPLVGRLLDDAARGRIPRHPQDLRQRRWYGRRPPHGGRLPWALPARRVADLVRAADYSPFPSPWGHPRCTLDGVEIEVVRTAVTGIAADAAPGTVGAPDGDGVRVAAADEWVVVERLRRDGRPAKPADALAGGRFADEPDDVLADARGAG